jgi:hypothetical protein
MNRARMPMTPLEWMLWVGAGLVWIAGGVPGVPPIAPAPRDIGLVRLGDGQICRANPPEPRVVVGARFSRGSRE